ncbi:MAG: chorismate mutase [Christensenellaceae bacterium]|jgi:chorismate mutase/prephenate dehydratase|nr:chorismate mutase [Christensenellaceae bacterium]
MERQGIRQEIDEIDEKLVGLFKRRMELSLSMADWKRESGQPIFDQGREREVINRVSELAGEELAGYARVWHGGLLDVSRSIQNQALSAEDRPIAREVRLAREGTPRLFPESATVACQGVEGAYSQEAAVKLFQNPKILYVESFDGVFRSVESGLCRYGVLPIENSSAGSVTTVYDLLKSKGFYVVRSTALHIRHALLCKAALPPEKIRKIYSHEQALRQCARYLGSLSGVQVLECANTAVAAKMAAEAEAGEGVAAISSPACAALYNLKTLDLSIQDESNNHTRFICISKKLEIYPGANKVSLMMALPHRAGTLYRALARIAALNLNLTKIESRVIPGSDFEFMFYFDIGASIEDERVIRLLAEFERDYEELNFIGAYSEA